MYKWILAGRYLVRRRITILAVAAVALCVFIVVVVMTVMNGLVDSFRAKNHDFAGDCVIGAESLVGFAYYEEFLKQIEAEPYVEAASPVVRGFGLLTQPGEDWNMGVEITGIDPVRHSLATGFGRTLYYNRNNPAAAFTPPVEPNAPGCVVGIDMMPQGRSRSGEYSHAASPGRFELVLSCFPLTARGVLARAATDIVATQRFLYSDDTHSGLVRVDGRMIYIPLATAQTLLGMDGPDPRISAVHLRFVAGTTLDAGCEKVRLAWRQFVAGQGQRPYANLLDQVRVESWIENRRATIAPMEKEQTLLIFLFLMLGVITVFIIFVVFYMIISHKSKDIGILRSVGVSPGGVAQLFLLFAAAIALVGTALGMGAAVAFLVRINDVEDWLYKCYNWQLWDRSVYAIGKIPNEIDPGVLAVIALCAVGACLCGALIPTWQAARRTPAEVLQVSQL